ncbi:hypothetical protein [Streptomyces sp. NPDC053728]|uniref:hypothetical protein n=1 Tax=Streptomyces sp. NPDC053728 TaxID=3155534 RepID=UPI00344186F6
MRTEFTKVRGAGLMGTAPRLALCGALIVISMSGCGGSGADDEQQSELSASQVCDGALGPAGVAALKRISAAVRFTELTGSNAIGEPHAFSLPLAASHLHDDLSDRNQCQPYKGDSDRPVLSIDFEARENHSDPAEVTGGARDLAIYEIGRIAVTHADGGATLVFACSTKDGGQSTPYVRANLTVAKGQVAPDSTPKDQMTVLNDASRALAKEVGCAAEAKLPAKVPDALPR